MKRFLCCLGSTLLWSSVPALGTGVAEVVYDRDQDQIAIRARDVTLSQLFAQLAQEAGIESRIDATVAADLLNVDQPLRPSMEVFQRLLGRYSYTLHYRNVAKNRRQLGAVTIVGAAGKTGGSAPPPAPRVGVRSDSAARGAEEMASIRSGVNAVDAEEVPSVSQQAPSVSAPAIRARRIGSDGSFID